MTASLRQHNTAKNHGPITIMIIRFFAILLTYSIFFWKNRVIHAYYYRVGALIHLTDNEVLQA